MHRNVSLRTDHDLEVEGVRLTSQELRADAWKKNKMLNKRNGKTSMGNFHAKHQDVCSHCGTGESQMFHYSLQNCIVFSPVLANELL